MRLPIPKYHPMPTPPESRGRALYYGVRATLAQLVERLIRNQQVAGSIPAGGSI